MSTRWCIHMYAGIGHETTPVLKAVEQDDVVLLEMDILRSKGFNLLKLEGVYRALLWGAATGRIEGIIGAPPSQSASPLRYQDRVSSIRPIRSKEELTNLDGIAVEEDFEVHRDW